MLPNFKFTPSARHGRWSGREGGPASPLSLPRFPLVPDSLSAAPFPPPSHLVRQGHQGH